MRINRTPSDDLGGLQITETLPAPKLLDTVLSVSSERILLSAVIEGDPVAHERPRLGKHGNTYTPRPTQAYKEKVAWLIKSLVKPASDPHERYGVRAIFCRSNRQRIDVDNLLKSILDACTWAHVWCDDSQVREISATLLTAQPSPRVEFIVYRFCDPSPVALCKGCRTPLHQGKGRGRVYCSKVCADKSKRATLHCVTCKRLFDLPQSLAVMPSGKPRRFCSRPCSRAFYSAERRQNGSDKWRCKHCGGRVSRKEYTQCKACLIRRRKADASNFWKLRHTPDATNSQRIMGL